MARKKPAVEESAVELALESVTPELPVVNIRPLIDEAITKIRLIDSVGHMHYVRKYMAEAIDVLQQLKASA